ncbi:MAG: hypothetical protein KKB79_03055 [Nanoarchaeota archaeon]|nr:hypothetical protein [Nanoarchaeota archaeon]
MEKRLPVFGLFFLILIVSFSLVLAENQTDDSEDLFKGYGDAALEQDAGTAPGDFLYFIDKFFDRFGDDLEVREERIAEIKAMIEAGDFEGAREALQEYKKLAGGLEKEIDPSRRDEALRSASAIRNAIRGIQDQIPSGERDEFVRDILDHEKTIATSAEISSKIKELCSVLSELDPNEYSRICSIGEDAPEWQKKLNKELTNEQREEAKKFGKIMSQCFDTSGQDCACENIPFTEFSKMCSIAAPLATACDINGDEAACEKLNNLQMPKLPPHLQEVLNDLEGDVSESKYDMHMPRECVEAGVTNPRECGRIMIETNAPPECKQVLLDSNCDSEKECRSICDKIMMEVHAPDCAKKGITDPNECARLMDSSGDDGGRRDGSRMDFNCQKVSDPTERLNCYDKASSQVDSRQGGFDDDYSGLCMTNDDWDKKKQECKNLYGEHAGDEPVYGDSGEGYECVIDATCVDFGRFKEENNPWEGCEALYCGAGSYCEYGECKPFEGYVPEGENKGGFAGTEGGPTCDDCASKCEERSGQRLKGTDCGPNGCECYYESAEPQYSPGEGSGEPGDYDNHGEAPSSSGGDAPSESSSGLDTSSGSSEPAPASEPELVADSITGNAFLKYYK